MTTSDVLSSLAIGVSLLSLAWQVRTWQADRTRVRTRSQFYLGDEERPPTLRLSIAVDGPRQVVLRLLCEKLDNGNWSGTYLGDDYKMGLRLSDGAHFETTLTADELWHFDYDEGDLLAVHDFYFEDSLGRKYPVQDCKKNIERLRDEAKRRRALRASASILAADAKS